MLKFSSDYGRVGGFSLNYYFHAQDDGRNLRIFVDQNDIADILRVPGGDDVENALRQNIGIIQRVIREVYDTLPDEAKTLGDIQIELF